MAATTTDRNTKARYIERQIRLVLAAATTIPAGAMVAVNAAGLAVNASDTAALIVMGRAEAAATSVGGADTEIVVSRGVFLWGNNGNVLQAHVGTSVTIVDNQTVGLAADTANDIIAGWVEEIDAEGVWVSMLGGKIAAA